MLGEALGPPSSLAALAAEPVCVAARCGLDDCCASRDYWGRYAHYVHCSSHTSPACSGAAPAMEAVR